MSQELKEKKIFNQESREDFMEARMVGGNPNGIINFNRTPHKFFTGLYKSMLARTWFAEQVNISKDKINYSKLTPEEKRSYDLVLAQLIANDSIQTNQLMDSFNRYITSPVVNACLARQAMEECYIEGTEVLTADGFKDFRNLSYNDLVANYCENGTIYFNHPSHITVRPHNGELVQFSQLNYNQIVTPNHNVISRYRWDSCRVAPEKQGKIRREHAIQTSVHNHNLPVAGYNTNGIDIVFSPLDALAVAWQADGTLVNNQTTPTRRGYCYQFTFKRQDKIDRMNTLILLTGCDYTITHDKNGFTHFYIWVDRKFDKNFDWVYLPAKNYLWLMNFISELRYWVGSNRPDNSVLFTNTNKKAINKVQAIAALCGCQTGAYWFKVDNSKVECCQLHIVMGKDHKCGREMKKNIIPYNGMVYCCTVDTGMIVCKYKDTIFISGNCVHAQSYSIMAEDICQDTDRIYKMHEVDEELQIKNEAVAKMYDTIYNNFSCIVTKHFNGDETKKIVKNQHTPKTLAIAAVANQILEGMVFQTGFAVIYSLENKLPGSAELIKEIHKDEF